LTTAIGIFIFLYAKSIVGLYISATAIITLALVYFFITYLTYIMIAIGIILLSVIAYILYLVFVQNKGLEQIIYGVQRLKSPENKEQVNQIMEDVQDNSTKKLVKNIKGHL